MNPIIWIQKLKQAKINIIGGKCCSNNYTKSKILWTHRLNSEKSKHYDMFN